VGLLPPLPRLVAPDPAGDRHAVEQEATTPIKFQKLLTVFVGY
jgi:hypothetical protein